MNRFSYCGWTRDDDNCLDNPVFLDISIKMGFKFRFQFQHGAITRQGFGAFSTHAVLIFSICSVIVMGNLLYFIALLQLS